jgi:hypothetical protein
VATSTLHGQRLRVAGALRDFFGLRRLDVVDYGIFAAVMLIWMHALCWAWVTKAFDRLFGYDEGGQSG